MLSSPLFMTTHLIESHSLVSEKTFSYCYEDWGSTSNKQFYAMICLITQYLGPCLVVGVAYAR